MDRKAWFETIGMSVAFGVVAMGPVAFARDEPPRAETASAATPAGDFTGEDSCSYKFNGYTITGYARVRMTKVGQKVTATVTEYRIAGADSGRNKANVDSDMRVWNNAAGSGAGTYFGTTYSADAMRQDGQWHALNQAMGKDPGFDVRRVHVGVLFTFDMAGGDPHCWADHFNVTF